MSVTIAVFLFFFALCFGSFVNAFVWRLHEQEEVKEQDKKADRQYLKDLSISKGRSMCPHCKHELAAKDLVPVLSWLSLGGKCRYCKMPMSWQYPVVELATATPFLLSYFTWPFTFTDAGLFTFVLWLVFLVNFMALAVYDLKWFLLPNKIVYPLILLAVLQVIVVAFIYGEGLDYVLNATVGALAISGTFYALFVLSNGNWIGGGDAKLGIVLGALAGTPLKAFLVIFLASVIGMLVSLPLLVQGKANARTQLPFGPFLIAATLIIVLFGDKIILWYGNLLQI